MSKAAFPKRRYFILATAIISFLGSNWNINANSYAQQTETTKPAEVADETEAAVESKVFGTLDTITRQFLDMATKPIDPPQASEGRTKNYIADQSPTFFADGTIAFHFGREKQKEAFQQELGLPWQPTRYGKYSVWVYFQSTSSCEIELKIDATSVEASMPATGDRLSALHLSDTHIHDEKQNTSLLIRAVSSDTGEPITNESVRLHSLILLPCSEHDDPMEPFFTHLKFQPGQTIKLHSSVATVMGKTLRYEPNPKKNTLGYWSNPKDQAFWDFEVTGETAEKQSYEVEILQGCGKDSGGSEVTLSLQQLETEKSIHHENNVDAAKLEFTVVDTGHWQNFQARKIGKFKLESGHYRLTVTPKNKKNVAVMDLRQIQLLPVESEQ